MVTTSEPRATLTVEEAAAVLGIGRTLAFEMARAGRLPVIRLGRRILVPRAALERMLEQAAHSNDAPNEEYDR